MKDVYALNRQFREDLLRREYKAVRNVLRSYERAWKSIARDLEALVRRIEAAQAAGTEISPSWFYREARYRTLLDEINSRYQQLAAECTEFTASGVKMAVPLGARHAYQLGKNAIVGEFAGLPSSATESMVGLFASGPVRALFAELGPLALREASRVLIDAMAKGENPRKAARLLRQSVEELTKRRAVLIARTEMIRSYRLAAQRTYQLNADVLGGWRWTCAKTRATCPLCLAMDGEIFPVTETLSSHPACRCAMVPVPAIDFGKPKPETGAEWFAKQPAFVQNRMLGSKTKGAMYRSGGFSLKDLVDRTYSARWGGSYRQRTIGELQRLAREGKLRTAASPPLSGYTPRLLTPEPIAKPVAPIAEPFDFAKAEHIDSTLAGNARSQAMIHWFEKGEGYVDWEAAPKEIKDAMHIYTGPAYENINKGLRGIDGYVHTEGEANAIAAMDKDFDYRLRKDTVLARRLDTDIFHELGLGEGSEFLDKGFVSTTVESQSFAMYRVLIGARKGTRAAPLYTISSYDYEYELLLNRGSRFRIVRREVVMGENGIPRQSTTWLEVIE